MGKERCVHCNSTQTKFLKKKRMFTCYDCDGDDWEKKIEEDDGIL